MNIKSWRVSCLRFRPSMRSRWCGVEIADGMTTDMVMSVIIQDTEMVGQIIRHHMLMKTIGAKMAMDAKAVMTNEILMHIMQAQGRLRQR